MELYHLSKYVGYHTCMKNKPDPSLLEALCGSNDYYFAHPSRNTAGFFRGGTDNACDLVCETCILIHFADPENTEYLED